MRRVLFIDCAPFVGGAQESFTTLVKGFPCCSVAVGDGLASRFPDAIHIHARHWSANISGIFQFLEDRREATKALQKTSCDLIHANTLRSALLLTSLPLSCPIVVHDRDIRAPRLALHYIARKLQPTIIAISSTVARKWRGIIPDDRIHIVHNGFNLDEIRAAKPASFPWHGPTIALVADFIPWKRHRLFIEAFVLAAKRAPNLHAVIRGRARTPEGEPYLNSIRNYASSFPNITFDISSSSALSCIAASDMLVTCSDNEPFGRIIIEGLALSKPVVATPTAAPPELFSMLAPNLIMALDSPLNLANAIADNLNKTFPPLHLDKFSAQAMLAKVNAVHEQIASSPKTTDLQYH